MFLYQNKMYLFSFLLYLLTLYCNVQGYPNKYADGIASNDVKSESSRDLPVFFNIPYSVRLNKRNVFESKIQLPPVNEGNSTKQASNQIKSVANDTISLTDDTKSDSNNSTGSFVPKSNSVKKNLKDENVANNITSVPSNTTLTVAHDESSSTPSVKLNVTENPLPQNTSIPVTTEPEKSSTPKIEVKTNTTVDNAKNVTVKATDKSDSDSGAQKRGLIVFGTLGMLTASYLAYKIYKRRKLQRNNDLSFYPNNNEQFKYGVLMSNENDDNMELSSIPQTIDSDDEEIEIFDLENKKFLVNERHVSSNVYRDQQPKKESSPKDDVEILDLNLPGTSEGDPLRAALDDNLLDFDDVLNIEAASSRTNESFKTKNKNDFFDIL